MRDCRSPPYKLNTMYTALGLAGCALFVLALFHIAGMKGPPEI